MCATDRGFIEEAAKAAGSARRPPVTPPPMLPLTSDQKSPQRPLKLTAGALKGLLEPGSPSSCPKTGRSPTAALTGAHGFLGV